MIIFESILTILNRALFLEAAGVVVYCKTVSLKSNHLKQI